MEQFKGEVKISTEEYKRLLLSELALKEANVLKITKAYDKNVYEYLNINDAIEEISDIYEIKRSLIDERWEDSIKRNSELITENKNLSNRILELEIELVRYRKKRKFLWLFKI